MKNIHFGHKLKEAMDKSGMTRRVIANRVQISEANLYKLIKSDDIKIKTLLRLAMTLDVPLQYFFEVKDSQLVEELKQIIENERLKISLLEAQIKFNDQQYGLLIGLLKNLEKEIEGPAEPLTLINHKIKQKIPLSTFIGIFYRMITSANKLPEKEKMYVKYTGEFLNIVEVRQALKDYAHLYPKEIQEILTEIVPDIGKDEYIDFEKIWNNS